MAHCRLAKNNFKKLLTMVDASYIIISVGWLVGRLKRKEMIHMTNLLQRKRGFEEVDSKFVMHDEVTILPVRGDKGSAGYDFYSKEVVTIQPGKSYLFWTDVCAYMQEDEVLLIHVRSSIGIKKGLVLKNTTGVIDSSYYANPSNGGNIGICLYNNSNKPVTIERQERSAQGCFHHYLVADEDVTLHEERVGGIGSSNR